MKQCLVFARSSLFSTCSTSNNSNDSHIVLEVRWSDLNRISELLKTVSQSALSKTKQCKTKLASCSKEQPIVLQLDDIYN